jgi:hypothetical protein
VGTELTVQGSGFTGVTAVSFNGTAASSFTADSDISLRATVAAGTSSGQITVTSPGGTATSASSFTVLLSPSISSFAPTSGPVGTEVTVQGSGFTGVTAVSFSGTAASSFTVDSDISLRATVAAGTTTGQISITGPEGTGTSSSNFTVLLPPSITSFAPPSGPVGTEVTVQGSHFTGVTTVSFNGTAASSFTVDSDISLRATVAAGTSSGQITVTSPGGTATSASSFTVLLPPSISSFAPTSGPVGTEVTVQGSHFTGVTAVSFNGTAASSFTADSDVALRATVAAGTTTGQISITGPEGTGTSASSFTVLLPPSIASFAPTSGPVGTEMTIQGSHFTAVTAVAFNGTGASSFTADSDTSLRATVAAGTSSGQITVTSPGGTATSASSFTVLLPPSITSFAPPSGSVGTEVTVQGSGFTGVTAVAFNGTAASSFTADSDVALRATVAAATSSGQITVTSPGGTATSASSFTVLLPPSITSFAPTSGPIGTEVTVQGSGFTGVTAVSFNGTAASSFTVESDVALRATVAAGTGSGPISITSPGGTATSASSFTVLLPPSISSFAPTSGTVGTEVTVQGSGFTGVTAVSFNGTGASSFTVDSDVALRATVAAATTTGTIAVTGPGGTATSASSFTVLLPPSITSFAPTSGTVGTEVTVQGERFTGVTAVSFNGTAASSFTVDSDIALRATVAAGTTTGTIAVTGPGGTATSASSFTVLLPPSITSFAPTSGPVGTEVTVQGSGFTGVTAVSFNGTAASSFTVDSDVALRATVAAATTTGTIAVTGPGGTATSASSFTVLLPPSITSFAPPSGTVGTEVTVQGSRFTGVTAVSFNGTAASSFVVDSDIALRATVAAGTATGTIRVTNGAGSAESGPVFTVTSGPSQVLLIPTDDTRVDSSVPTKGYGSSTYLRVKSFSTTSATHHSYLKFNVTGLTGTVQSAKIRLYVTDESVDGGSIFTVSNNYLGTTTPWTESGVTWNNAPTIGGTPLDQKGAVALNTWVEFDVTPAISGNGIYSFGLTSGSTNSAQYSSTEGANLPELVVLVNSAAVPSANLAPSTVVGNTTPRAFALRQNHPNPFGVRTSIRFELPRPGKVRLTVYDVLGRLIRTVVDGHLPAGEHEVPWDARDNGGSLVSSGVYLVRIEAEGFTSTRKLLRMR